MKEKKRDLRLETDRDFIVSERYNNNLSELISNYPDGVPDKVICRTLQITQKELETYYDCAIINLKKVME